MNRALTNQFLALLINSTLQAFQATLRQAPNMIFGQVLTWFVERFGQSNETERPENRLNMEPDLSFDNGVETLINHIDSGLKLVSFTEAIISDNETVDMAIGIVLKTGLFREAYTAWHARQATKKTWYVFQVLMGEQCHLHCLTSARANSFGNGDNANNAAEDSAFKGMVANIGATHAANQCVVQALVQRNNA